MIDETKLKTKAKRDEDDDEPQVFGVAETTDDGEPDIDALLAEYADVGRYVLLERWDISAWTFLDKLDIAEASIVSIKQRFGGGKYRMRIFGDENRKRKQVTFRIAGRSRVDDDAAVTMPVPVADVILERLERLETKLVPPTTNGEGATPGTGRDRLMDAIVARILTPTPEPKENPLLTTLITALIGRGRESDGVDPIELQKLLADAEGKGYERGKQLGEALAIAAGEGDGVARVIATALPSVVDAFKNAQTAYNGARPVTRAPTATATVAAPAPATVGETVSVNLIDRLRPAVPILVKWARSGKDAAIKAANTLDDLDDSVCDAIAVQAEEPHFVESVLTAIPEFQSPPEVRAWMITFLSTIQETLTSPDIDEGSTTGGTDTAEA